MACYCVDVITQSHAGLITRIKRSIASSVVYIIARRSNAAARRTLRVEDIAGGVGIAVSVRIARSRLRSLSECKVVRSICTREISRRATTAVCRHCEVCGVGDADKVGIRHRIEILRDRSDGSAAVIGELAVRAGFQAGIQDQVVVKFASAICQPRSFTHINAMLCEVVTIVVLEDD